MQPVEYHGGKVRLYPGDCLETLKALPSDSVDAVVTDPPYALVSIGKRFGKAGSAPSKVGASGVYARASKGFMGKSWDNGERAFAVDFWAEVYRVLKPGGHVLAFSATRTVHRLTCAIEDAGFEIRDMIAWLYASGFPKSHDVSRGIDALDAAKLRRERALSFTAWLRSTGITSAAVNSLTGSVMASHFLTAGEQPEIATSEMFDRLRSALPEVPDWIEALVRERTVESENLKRRTVVGHHDEPALAARWREEYSGELAAEAAAITVPYSEDAQRWAGWGTALKPAIEPITVARKPLAGTVAETVLAHGTGALNVDACRVEMSEEDQAAALAAMPAWNKAYPPGHSKGSLSLSGGVDGSLHNRDRTAYDPSKGRWPANIAHDASGEVEAAFPVSGGSSAARFFFSAKAGDEDRIGSKHPTVKPVDLMRWLVRLVTPPGGTVLDPFAGSGTTGEAAFREGFNAILCERDPEYLPDIARRIELALAGPAIRRAERAKARGKAPKPAPLFGEP